MEKEAPDGPGAVLPTVWLRRYRPPEGVTPAPFTDRQLASVECVGPVDLLHELQVAGFKQKIDADAW